MPTHLIALLLLWPAFAAPASAQKTNTWKGGAPGRETHWHCPRNWSAGAVPDAFSDVVIPDVSTSTFAAPVIGAGEWEANALLLLPGARLTLADGAQLIVYGPLHGADETTVGGPGVLRLQSPENPGAGTAAARQH